MRKYTCGVPSANCSGGVATINHALRSTISKVHSSPQEAFRCYARYLVNVLGYTKVGNREFQATPASPITVLTKKSRFGGVMRQGKREKGTKRGRRVTPKKLSGGLVW